jgi:hypothetical protein
MPSHDVASNICQALSFGVEGFIAVIASELLLVGGAEAYRTGLLENPFPELAVGNVYPGKAVQGIPMLTQG